MSSKGKKIMFLGAGVDYYGAPKILLETVGHLMQAGHSAIVIFPDNGPIIADFKAIGAEVRIVNLAVLRRKYFNPLGILTRMFVFIYAMVKLSHMAKRENVALIFSNTVTILPGTVLAWALKKPHIWHIHEMLQPKSFLNSFYKIFFRLVNQRFIAVSVAVKSYWQTIIPSGSSIQLIYNGIEYPEQLGQGLAVKQELGLKEREILIGMVGRVSTWKGQDFFIKVAKQVSLRHDNVKFVMIGDAFSGYEYLYDELRQLIRDLQLEGTFHYLGFRKDVPELLDAMDIFVLPSQLPDPFPTVVLEAMGHAKAIVATKQGGAMEMIESNVSGKLVPVDNPAIAAEAIDDFIRNPTLREEMGRNARIRVKSKFSRSAFGYKITKLISDTIKE